MSDLTQMEQHIDCKVRSYTSPCGEESVCLTQSVKTVTAPIVD
jgi:hypothetical protein